MNSAGDLLTRNTMRLLRKLGIRVFAVFQRALDDRQRATNLGDLSLTVLDYPELRRKLANSLISISEAYVDSAEKRGDVCVAALDGDRVVSYAWRTVVSPVLAENEMWARFNPPNHYGGKAFTEPDYRGRRIIAALLPLADRLMMERGFTHAISYTDIGNTPAMRMNSRACGKPIGYAGYLMIPGRTFTFSTAGARAQGFEFFDPRVDPIES